MENFKYACVVWLAVLFFGRNSAENVIECGIALKVPCKCGDQDGVQDVWAPSCKAQNSTKRNNCLPCPGACDPFLKCKTCSESGCLSCPEGKYGKFCDSDEPQAIEKALNLEGKAPLKVVENPIDENIPALKEETQDTKLRLAKATSEAKDQPNYEENIPTPKEDNSFQDTKLKLAKANSQGKDQPNHDGPLWQTLDLLSNEEKEKNMFKTFFRGDISNSNDNDQEPVEYITEDIRKILKDNYESEELSGEREDTTPKVLIRSEDLSKMTILPSFRIMVKQAQPEEQSNNEEKPDILLEKESPLEEASPLESAQITSEDNDSNENNGVVGPELQPEEGEDLPDFEPDNEQSEDEDYDLTDEKNLDIANFSEQGFEEPETFENTNMTDIANQSGAYYRDASSERFNGMPESTNASASSSSESVHLNILEKFPIPLKGILKGLVKLEMLVTSMIHLDGKEDSKNTPTQSKEPEIIGLSPELRLRLKDSKSLLDTLTSCDEHPEIQSPRLFLYMYDPRSPKIAHVHLFNISQGPIGNQPRGVAASNQSKDIQTSYLSYRGQNSKPIGFEQVMNPPISELSPHSSNLNPLPLLANSRPSAQYRQPLPFVNSLESKVEKQPSSDNKPKHQVRVFHLDKLMNFPSIKTRHEPILLTPDAKKQDKRPLHSGQRKSQSDSESEEKDLKTQDAENTGRKELKAHPRKREPLRKQSEKIRIKVVNDENVKEYSEFLMTQQKGDTKGSKSNSGENIFESVLGGSKENASDRTSNNATRIRKHLFRLKRDDSEWCPIQKAFRNGDLDCTIWSYQKICTLTCHPGFTGPTIYKCVPRGEWDPPLKSCTKIKKQKKANPPYRSLDSGKDESFPSYDGDLNDEEFEALMYD